jgi:hypothetical protein
MSNQINDLLQDSQAQFRAQRSETKNLVTKWEKTGLLEGISQEYDKHNTAILLENQAKQLISEANTTTTGTGKEDWNGVALPLVRRIFGELSAKEFVSVQPMNLPSGLVFWLDFKYGGQSGDDIGKGRHDEGQSLFGNATNKGKAVLTDGLYGGETATTGPGGGVGYSLSKKSVGLLVGEESGSGIVTINTIGAFYSAGTMVDPDYDTAGAWYVVSGSTTAPYGTNVYEVAARDGFDLTFQHVVGGAPLDLSASVAQLFYYQNTSTANLRGDFEDRDIAEIGNATPVGSDLKIPELEVNLTNEALVAKTRKLKVKWSPEFAQDLNAYHSIDAEAELTSMLSEYITMEIDLEILAMLSEAARSGGFTSTFTAAAPAAGETFGDAFAQLGIKMQAMSNAIHQSTMRGGANFAVCSPQIATYLESIAGYAANTDGTAANFAMGVTAIGSLSNRFTIYKNPYWTGNEILMGFRGSQFLETGAVFAPYIPLIMTPLVYDPTNFTPRKGVMTRYAKKVVRNDFYGTITITSSAWDSISALPS